ncbi:hypothetical protein Plec18170_009002 [Paecilomyces lecythidis]
MHRLTQILALLMAAATMVPALPSAKRDSVNSVEEPAKLKREELYRYPELGRIVVEDIDKREELYAYPELGRIKVEDIEERDTEKRDLGKRNEIYPLPELGRIVVEDVE